jgi:hypothetical protein
MPALDADLTRLSHHQRPTAGSGRPRGAALSPSAAPLTPVPHPAHVDGAACCRRCSVELAQVELPGEAA